VPWQRRFICSSQPGTEHESKVKALALCNEGIARYPKYNRINALKEVRQEILASSLSFS
jgi:hypothetical protein